MKRGLKIAAICAAVLIVLLVVVPFFIPVNQFRPTIEAQASQALGRKVQLGDLSFSLLRGSVTAQDLSIADDPSFSTSAFLQAKTLNVGVKIMPLIFSRSLEVTGITIEQPEVTLLQNPAGTWNFASLGGGQSSSTQSSGASTTAFVIEKFTLKDGRINIGSTNAQKRSTYDQVEVESSNVSMTAKFPVIVSLSLPGGGTFKLTGNVGPINLGNATLTPLDAKLEVHGLNIASSGLVNASAGLGGLLDVNAGFVSQTGMAETNGDATLAKALLVAGGSAASVPATLNFDTKYDLTKNTGVLNPSTLKIGNAAAQLSGTYQMAADATTVNVKLDAKGMPAADLESFLPAVGVNLPKGASLQAGTIDADLGIAGSTNNLVTTGNVGLFSAKLAGFDLGSKMGAISSLAGLKTGNDLAIDKVTTNLRVAPNGIEVSDFQAVLPSLGNLAGGGDVNASNQLDFKMAATVTSGLGALASPVTGVAALMGKATGGQSGCKNGTTVPFMIQGTMSDPKFVPDVGGLAAGMLKSQLGCVGNAAGGLGGNAAKAAGALSGVTGLFGKKKTQ
jgi:AsmA protein